MVIIIKYQNDDTKYNKVVYIHCSYNQFIKNGKINQNGKINKNGKINILLK